MPIAIWNLHGTAMTNCDHSRSMRARAQVRMREILGKRIRHLEHKTG